MPPRIPWPPPSFPGTRSSALVKATSLPGRGAGAAAGGGGGEQVDPGGRSDEAAGPPQPPVLSGGMLAALSRLAALKVVIGACDPCPIWPSAWLAPERSDTVVIAANSRGRMS